MFLCLHFQFVLKNQETSSHSYTFEGKLFLKLLDFFFNFLILCEFPIMFPLSESLILSSTALKTQHAAHCNRIVSCSVSVYTVLTIETHKLYDRWIFYQYIIGYTSWSDGKQRVALLYNVSIQCDHGEAVRHIAEGTGSQAWLLQSLTAWSLSWQIMFSSKWQATTFSFESICSYIYIKMVFCNKGLIEFTSK